MENFVKNGTSYREIRLRQKVANKTIEVLTGLSMRCMNCIHRREEYCTIKKHNTSKFSLCKEIFLKSR